MQNQDHGTSPLRVSAPSHWALITPKKEFSRGRFQNKKSHHNSIFVAHPAFFSFHQSIPESFHQSLKACSILVALPVSSPAGAGRGPDGLLGRSSPWWWWWWWSFERGVAPSLNGLISPCAREAFTKKNCHPPSKGTLWYYAMAIPTAEIDGQAEVPTAADYLLLCRYLHFSRFTLQTWADICIIWQSVHLK